MADDHPLRCTFALNGQTTSTLTCPGFGSVAAFSGQKEGRNNGWYDAKEDIGPIPPGTYYIVDRQSDGRLGWLRDLRGGDRVGWARGGKTEGSEAAGGDPPLMNARN